mgnify:FL=1
MAPSDFVAEGKQGRVFCLFDISVVPQNAGFGALPGLGITIESLKMMPDHVHLFVKPPPVLAPHYVIGQFKGQASHIRLQAFTSFVSRLPRCGGEVMMLNLSATCQKM